MYLGFYGCHFRHGNIMRHVPQQHPDNSFRLTWSIRPTWKKKYILGWAKSSVAAISSTLIRGSAMFRVG
jgi:hypothetical protein